MHSLQNEIEQVLDMQTDADIIYNMPVKAPSYVKYARDVTVQVMSFDNTFELDKVTKPHTMRFH